MANTMNIAIHLKRFGVFLLNLFHSRAMLSRIYELYEKIFTAKQTGKSLPEYYSILKSLWDQFVQHWPITTDLEQQKQHWEDVIVASLSSLDSDLCGFKEQILVSNTIPTALNISSQPFPYNTWLNCWKCRTTEAPSLTNKGDR